MKDSEVEALVQQRRTEIQKIQRRIIEPTSVVGEKPVSRRTMVQNTTHTNTVRPRYYNGFGLD